MNEFQAAMGICNLRHVDDEIAKRKKVDERYREHLDGIVGIKLSQINPNIISNYAYFPIIFEKEFGVTRDEVADALQKERIYARKYFYPLTSAFECFKNKYNVNLTPVALHMSQSVLTVPMYADLPLSEVDRICDIILQCRS